LQQRSSDSGGSRHAGGSSSKAAGGSYSSGKGAAAAGAGSRAGASVGGGGSAAAKVSAGCCGCGCWIEVHPRPLLGSRRNTCSETAKQCAVGSFRCCEWQCACFCASFFNDQLCAGMRCRVCCLYGLSALVYLSDSVHGALVCGIQLVC
jgi:hypothetical protein